ncbi:MAG: hypothetical protein J2P17_11490 [Mycobacterium sp.]|nr:hypothetical protein [Mycobacterium sp.]
MLILLGVVAIGVASIVTLLTAKLIHNPVVAGVVAIGVMTAAVIGVLMDSFVIVDSQSRDGREVFIRLAAAGEPCECHSTWQGDKIDGKITRTCTPPGCDKHGR